MERPGDGRYEEKKSVFLSYAFPVANEEEALTKLAEIKNQYPDARHHVYAYRLRQDNKTRFSDDGEPSGTAGIPVLDLLRAADLTDTLVVVVRYFGGTLLGTGGLVRAYTAAAKQAIEKGNPVTYVPALRVKASAGYSDYKRLESLLSRYTVVNQQFAEEVSFEVVIAEEALDRFTASVRETTAGRCVAEVLE
ncbi:MAG: IMPACT family protein, partial [Eubacteriales bacterium]